MSEPNVKKKAPIDGPHVDLHGIVLPSGIIDPEKLFAALDKREQELNEELQRIHGARLALQQADELCERCGGTGKIRRRYGLGDYQVTTCPGVLEQTTPTPIHGDNLTHAVHTSH